MRFHGTIERASRAAKRLRDATNHHRPSPYPLKLGEAQRAIAMAWGYSDWSELGRRCELSPDSLFDEDADSAVVADRKARQVVLLSLMLDLDTETAVAVAATAGITSRSPLARRRTAAETAPQDMHFPAPARAYGAVIFDDPMHPSAGWAASPRGPAPFRIRNAHDLPQDVLWWTNVPYRHFFRSAAEVWRTPNLRHDQYLPLSMTDLLREWGHSPATIDADTAVSICAERFTTVMNVAASLFHAGGLVDRPGSAFQGNTLSHDLEPLLPPGTALPSELEASMPWKWFTVTSVSGPAPSRVLLLRRSRQNYAMAMLGTPLPVGPVEPLEAEDMRGGLRSGQTLAAVQVRLRGVPGSFSEVAGYGVATGATWRGGADWTAAQDWHADHDIVRAYGSTGSRALIHVLGDAVSKLAAARDRGWGWSSGVVAECLWRAACLRGPSARNQNMTWEGFAVRSADRASMFTDAMRLHALDHAVISYGAGWIRVLVTEARMRDLILDAGHLGLSPPLVDVPHDLVAGEVSSDDANPAQAMATMIRREARTKRRTGVEP